MKKERQQRISGKRYGIFAVLFFCVAAGGAGLLLKDHISKEQAQNYYEDLTLQVNAATPTPTEESKVAPINVGEPVVSEPEKPELTEKELLQQQYLAAVPQNNIDWETLKAENADVYAWITVPGTTVDYPIVQHATDNGYYLTHTLDGKTAKAGSIYTENYNKKDFSDNHTVIYGHNLTVGTMFSSLHNFDKADLTNEEHLFYIYTEDNTLVYQIFAAYEFPAKHLLLNYELYNIYVYEQYLKDIISGYDCRPGGLHNIREGVELGLEDKIVTLSTCTNDHNKAYRFLVVGKLVAEANPSAEQTVTEMEELQGTDGK